MTTINILHCIDGTYAVTVNGEVVAAGLLSDAAAWRGNDILCNRAMYGRRE